MACIRFMHLVIYACYWRCQVFDVFLFRLKLYLQGQTQRGLAIYRSGNMFRLAFQIVVFI